MSSAPGYRFTTTRVNPRLASKPTLSPWNERRQQQQQQQEASTTPQSRSPPQQQQHHRQGSPPRVNEPPARPPQPQTYYAPVKQLSPRKINAPASTRQHSGSQPRPAQQQQQQQQHQQHPQQRLPSPRAGSAPVSGVLPTMAKGRRDTREDASWGGNGATAAQPHPQTPSPTRSSAVNRLQKKTQQSSRSSGLSGALSTAPPVQLPRPDRSPTWAPGPSPAQQYPPATGNLPSPPSARRGGGALMEGQPIVERMENISGRRPQTGVDVSHSSTTSPSHNVSAAGQSVTSGRRVVFTDQSTEVLTSKSPSARRPSADEVYRGTTAIPAPPPTTYAPPPGGANVSSSSKGNSNSNNTSTSTALALRGGGAAPLHRRPRQPSVDRPALVHYAGMPPEALPYAPHGQLHLRRFARLKARTADLSLPFRQLQITQQATPVRPPALLAPPPPQQQQQQGRQEEQRRPSQPQGNSSSSSSSFPPQAQQGKPFVRRQQQLQLQLAPPAGAAADSGLRDGYRTPNANTTGDTSTGAGTHSRSPGRSFSSAQSPYAVAPTYNMRPSPYGAAPAHRQALLPPPPPPPRSSSSQSPPQRTPPQQLQRPRVRHPATNGYPSNGNSSGYTHPPPYSQPPQASQEKRNTLPPQNMLQALVAAPRPQQRQQQQQYVSPPQNEQLVPYQPRWAGRDAQPASLGEEDDLSSSQPSTVRQTPKAMVPLHNYYREYRAGHLEGGGPQRPTPTPQQPHHAPRDDVVGRLRLTPSSTTTSLSLDDRRGLLDQQRDARRRQGWHSIAQHFPGLDPTGKTDAQLIEEIAARLAEEDAARATERQLEDERRRHREEQEGLRRLQEAQHRQFVEEQRHKDARRQTQQPRPSPPPPPPPVRAYEEEEEGPQRLSASDPNRPYYNSRDTPLPTVDIRAMESLSMHGGSVRIGGARASGATPHSATAPLYTEMVQHSVPAPSHHEGPSPSRGARSGGMDEIDGVPVQMRSLDALETESDGSPYKIRDPHHDEDSNGEEEGRGRYEDGSDSSPRAAGERDDDVAPPGDQTLPPQEAGAEGDAGEGGSRPGAIAASPQLLCALPLAEMQACLQHTSLEEQYVRINADTGEEMEDVLHVVQHNLYDRLLGVRCYEPKGLRLEVLPMLRYPDGGHAQLAAAAPPPEPLVEVTLSRRGFVHISAAAWLSRLGDGNGNDSIERLVADLGWALPVADDRIDDDAVRCFDNGGSVLERLDALFSAAAHRWLVAGDTQEPSSAAMARRCQCLTDAFSTQALPIAPATDAARRVSFADHVTELLLQCTAPEELATRRQMAVPAALAPATGGAVADWPLFIGSPQWDDEVLEHGGAEAAHAALGRPMPRAAARVSYSFVSRARAHNLSGGVAALFFPILTGQLPEAAFVDSMLMLEKLRLALAYCDMDTATDPATDGAVAEGWPRLATVGAQLFAFFPHKSLRAMRTLCTAVVEDTVDAGTFALPPDGCPHLRASLAPLVVASPTSADDLRGDAKAGSGSASDDVEEALVELIIGSLVEDLIARGMAEDARLGVVRAGTGADGAVSAAARERREEVESWDAAMDLMGQLRTYDTYCRVVEGLSDAAMASLTTMLDGFLATRIDAAALFRYADAATAEGPMSPASSVDAVAGGNGLLYGHKGLLVETARLQYIEELLLGAMRMQEAIVSAPEMDPANAGGDGEEDEGGAGTMSGMFASVRALMASLRDADPTTPVEDVAMYLRHLLLIYAESNALERDVQAALGADEDDDQGENEDGLTPGEAAAARKARVVAALEALFASLQSEPEGATGAPQLCDAVRVSVQELAALCPRVLFRPIEGGAPRPAVDG